MRCDCFLPGQRTPRSGPSQGGFSYTVVAGAQLERIVQFCAQSAALDMDKLELARHVHGPLVAQCTYHAHAGKGPTPLAVYVTERLPGLMYIKYGYL